MPLEIIWKSPDWARFGHNRGHKLSTHVKSQPLTRGVRVRLLGLVLNRLVTVNLHTHHLQEDRRATPWLRRCWPAQPCWRSGCRFPMYGHRRVHGTP